MRCVMKDLNAMIEFFETTGYDSDIAAFKAVVPDAQMTQGVVRSQGREVLDEVRLVVLVRSLLAFVRGRDWLRPARASTASPASRSWGPCYSSSRLRRRGLVAAGRREDAVRDGHRTQRADGRRHRRLEPRSQALPVEEVARRAWSCVSTRPRRQKGHRAL